MRATIFLLALTACGASSASDLPGTPVEGSGSGPARGFPASGFTAVDLAGVDDVSVHTGAGFAVRAEGDPAVLDKLRITREGETLHVGRKSGWSSGHDRAHVYVTMPRIVSATVSGTGSITIDRVDEQGFAADVAGTGSVRVAAAQLGKAALSISGAGSITVAGTARTLTASVSGVGSIDARALQAASAEVDASGTGGIKASVNGPAQVQVSGVGSVDLGPRARCTVSKSGLGQVHCGG